MHSVDSSHIRQSEPEGSSSSTASSPLPLQKMPTGETIARSGEGEVEVFKVGTAEIHLRKFLTAQPDGPCALYLHGIEGHSQWFANTAAILNQSGISVYAPDRRGCGLNLFDRGHVESHKNLLSDAEFFLQLITKRHPKSPIFLIGNCWGAKPAAIIGSETYKWENSPVRLNGLILICPAIKTKPDLSFTDKLSIAGALIAGASALRAQIPIPLTCAMFTDNSEYLTFIENDPLRLESASKAFYFASFVLSLMSAGTAKNINLPTLILQSDNDEIVDVPGIKQWFSQIKNADKRLKIYPGTVHSMDFDKDKFLEYAQDLSDWINARSGLQEQSK